MTLAQKFAEREHIGIHRNNVRLVRKNSARLTVPDMVEMLDIPEDDCKEILELISAHPDWTDDEIADHVMWEEWK